VVIASASRTEDPGFESRFLDLKTCIAVLVSKQNMHRVFEKNKCFPKIFRRKKSDVHLRSSLSTIFSDFLCPGPPKKFSRISSISPDWTHLREEPSEAMIK
jgi:hypothetical protein